MLARSMPTSTSCNSYVKKIATRGYCGSMGKKKVGRNNQSINQIKNQQDQGKNNWFILRRQMWDTFQEKTPIDETLIKLQLLQLFLTAA